MEGLWPVPCIRCLHTEPVTQEMLKSAEEPSCSKCGGELDFEALKQMIQFYLEDTRELVEEKMRKENRHNAPHELMCKGCLKPETRTGAEWREYGFTCERCDAVFDTDPIIDLIRQYDQMDIRAADEKASARPPL